MVRWPWGEAKWAPRFWRVWESAAIPAGETHQLVSLAFLQRQQPGPPAAGPAHHPAAGHPPVARAGPAAFARSRVQAYEP